MFVNSDFTDLLKSFNDHNIKYLVIGGYAYIHYAEPRFTKDMDLWISTDKDNAKKVYRALREFGAPLVNITETDFSEDGTYYQMGIAPVRVDIFMGVPGGNFMACWKKRIAVDFDGLLIPFISKEDLIKIKKASGRPQDLIDVDELQKPTLDH